MTRYYEYRHTVGFEETNLVGNVYYANFVRWQGRCREMFLKDHAPDIVEMLKDNFAIVTLHVSCDYFSELHAFDDVLIQMSLAEMVQNRITMQFDYHKADGTLCAKGLQQIACMKRVGDQLLVTEIPNSLRNVLQVYEGKAS